MTRKAPWHIWLAAYLVNMAEAGDQLLAASFARSCKVPIPAEAWSDKLQNGWRGWGAF